MKTYLHYFNWDLIRKIRDAEPQIAPKGYYDNVEITANSVKEMHMYYRGEDIEVKDPKVSTYYNEFPITEDMIIFEY